MSGPTFEIVKVVPTDAYKADETVLYEVTHMLAKTPGFVG